MTRRHSKDLREPATAALAAIASRIQASSDPAVRYQLILSTRHVTALTLPPAL